MKKLSLLSLLLLLTGCASFVTEQTDISYTDENGNEVRYIRTAVKAATRLESHSQLANFKATQTDKTQSANVGTLNQDTNPTNMVKIVEAAVEGAVKAATKP